MSQNDVTENENESQEQEEEQEEEREAERGAQRDHERIPLQPLRRATVTNDRRKSGNAPNQVVHVLSEEENPDLHELGLSYVLKPIVYSSMIFGLTWKRSRANRCDVCTVHSCLLLLILWYQAFRYFASYGSDDKYGYALFQKIIAHTWSIKVALGISVYIYSKHKNIPSFVRQWENYKLQYGGLTLSYMQKHVFRRVAIVNFIAILFMLISTIVWSIVQPKLLTKWLFPLLTDTGKSKLHTGLFILYLLIFVYCFLAWFQCALNTLCYCSLLKREFKQLTQQFCASIAEAKAQASAAPPQTESSALSENLARICGDRFQCEHYRIRYISLCLLVRKLDSVLNGYLSILYAFSTPMVILLLYGVWDTTLFSADKLSVLVGVGTIVYLVFLLVFITRSSSSLADAVSAAVPPSPRN